MLVDNSVTGDSRVQKAAASAAEAGWDVVLLGRSADDKPQTWQVGGAEVRLVPMPNPPTKRRFEHRRSWLRAPLGYPPTGIAEHRVRQVKAWRADLAARRAELAVNHFDQGGLRRAWRRTVLAVSETAAGLTKLWVGMRCRQLAFGRRGRRRLSGPWDRAYTAFWRLVLGHRAWRRLEPRLWDFELAFAGVVDELRPDLIHANDFYMLGVGARAMLRARAAGRRVKLVWDAHELVSGLKPRVDNLRWLPAHIAHEREYARYADAAITVSDQLAEILQRVHRLPVKPTVVLNAPVGRRDDDVRAPDLRALCGVDADTPVLVYSGAAAAQRGVGIMVEALPQLAGAHVALVVAQPQSAYLRSLAARAAELGAADRFHVLPYVHHHQVIEFLSGADVGVIPIHHWPNHEIALITKFMEYSHARLPIVVSDVKAMAETTRATGQGEVFRAQDITDYVRAVKAVLADPQRYRAAYDAPGLLENWTWEAQARTLDAVYSHLVENPLPGQRPPTAWEQVDREVEKTPSEQQRTAIPPDHEMSSALS
ncbi:glycosyltransferase family 4 protein [Catellatospora sichuanensis]|uniref:glycosyltransferase family 4 protein n=1 Tax=Catellatospora sichuanensis TaxID=1969805 RepID=UPI0011828CB3|nr:glycosyltransferase family 4 protein [Catellatospora sichuanensis]